MRAVVQRVARASVSVGEEQVAAIGPGMVVLLGIAAGDDDDTVKRLAAKVVKLRIFADSQGRMNEPLGERELLCISQFTLLGDSRKGNRPSFGEAARPDVAEPLYERFCELTGARRGRFGANMVVSLSNDGPVTLVLDA